MSDKRSEEDPDAESGCFQCFRPTFSCPVKTHATTVSSRGSCCANMPRAKMSTEAKVEDISMDDIEKGSTGKFRYVKGKYGSMPGDLSTAQSTGSLPGASTAAGRSADRAKMYFTLPAVLHGVLHSVRNKKNPELQTQIRETRNVSDEFATYNACGDMLEGHCSKRCCSSVGTDVPAMIINTPCCCVDLWQNFCCSCLAWVCGIKAAKRYITPKCNFCLGMENQDDSYTESHLTEFTKLWPSEDFDPNYPEDVDEYREVITTQLKASRQSEDGNVEVMKKATSHLEMEIEEVCTKNFSKRLEVLLEVATNFFLDADRKWYWKGQTPLHMALLYRSTEAAIILIEKLGKALLFKEMAGGYNGATALHIATANGNFRAIESMFTHLSGADFKKLLTKCATGEQFKKTLIPAELPLSLAVLSGNGDLVKLLIDNGAPLDGRDSRKNTVLHTLVLMSTKKPQEALEMYDLIVSRIPWWWCKKNGMLECRAKSVSTEIEGKHYLFQLTDINGITPLMLAAEKGTKEILEKILNTRHIYRFPQWEYGHTSNAYYDVTEIDPVLNRGKLSVLEILVNSKDENRIECLQIPVIARLLHIKWHNYRSYYITWGVVHIVYMLLLSFFTLDIMPKTADDTNVTKTIVNGTTTTLEDMPTTTDQPISTITCSTNASKINAMDLFILIGAISFFIYGISDVIKSSRGRGRSLWKHIRSHKLRVVMIVFSVTTVAWFCFKRSGHTRYQGLFLAISLLLGWSFTIFFTRGFRATSFFSAMLQRIMFGDLLRFMVIYIIVSVAFSTAIRAVVCHGLHREETLDELQNYRGVGTAMWTLFRLMVGLAEIQVLFVSENYAMAILLIAYVILINILLLNMLIATMTDTYTHISKYNDLIYKRLRTADMILLERMLPEVMRMIAVEVTYKVCRITSPSSERNIYLLDVDVTDPTGHMN